ncbi:ParB/RepB/Spo0J family partition protein [Streptomyces sp. NPDC058657]|uniref:ParB/RepB/Spo0J family partition protein n=1 Tax=unclassified Streptomyces TaxID=2593676 RepID=UPI0036564C1F
MAGSRFSLAELAGEKVEATPGAAKPTLAHLSPEQLVPTPLNPRQDFDKAKLIELGNSMRNGQLQPCVGIARAAYVKLFPEHADQVGPCRVVMAAGERRWKAAQEVGLKLLDVHIRADIASSREAFLAAVLAENMERANFNAIEEANGLKAMLSMTDGNQTRAAERVGKSKQWFSHHLGLLRLTEEMQALIIDGTITAFRDMRRYSALPAEEQRGAWEADQRARQEKKDAPKPASGQRPQPAARPAAELAPQRSEPGRETYTAVYAPPAEAQQPRGPREDTPPVPERAPASAPRADPRDETHNSVMGSPLPTVTPAQGDLARSAPPAEPVGATVVAPRNSAPAHQGEAPVLDWEDEAFIRAVAEDVPLELLCEHMPLERRRALAKMLFPLNKSD